MLTAIAAQLPLPKAVTRGNKMLQCSTSWAIHTAQWAAEKRLQRRNETAVFMGLVFPALLKLGLLLQLGSWKTAWQSSIMGSLKMRLIWVQFGQFYLRCRDLYLRFYIWFWLGLFGLLLLTEDTPKSLFFFFWMKCLPSHGSAGMLPALSPTLHNFLLTVIRG